MKAARWLADSVALFAAALAAILFIFVKFPRGLLLWLPRLFAAAVSPFLAVAGALAAAAGLLTRSRLALLGGLFSAFAFARYIWRVVAFDADAGLERAFGPGWSEQIGETQRSSMLRGHWTWRMPSGPRPTHLRDIPFATITGTSRQILCDLWLPGLCVERSGLAFIYLHGSAWRLGDKDYGTRPFFRHLAGQGHVVMDVAYRMYPETDMYGMVGDAKRAIAWMKANAAEYFVDPQRIVIGGGSAGGHLALLAAYSSGNPELTPVELQNQDLSVKGVVSYYGVADMTSTYYHTGQHITTRALPREPAPVTGGFAPSIFRRILGERYKRYGLDKPRTSSAFIYLLGGHPEEAPEAYRLFSPLIQAHPGCPPTLLVHGEEDVWVPAKATQQLEDKLRDAGVPVVSLYLPQTDHAFDLVLPRFSPPAQSALYVLERFLSALTYSSP